MAEMVLRLGGLAARSVYNELVTRSPTGMTEAVSKLARRGDDTGNPDNNPVSGVLVIMLVIYIVFGAFLLYLVQYPIDLFLTLAIVESPPAVYLPLESEDAGATIGSAPTPHLTRQGDERVFITGSIRRTFKHLRQLGGFFAMWRGIGPTVCLAITNSIVRGFFISILLIIFPARLASIFGGLASIIALSKFALVVTHIKISAPQPNTSLWSRIKNTTWAQAKSTIPALVVFAIASQVAIEFALLSNNSELPRNARYGIVSADLVAFVFLVLPATVLLTRVQASVLSDDVQTIVPFDKTFGQDTSSTNGVLTLQMAFHSLDFDICKRLGIFLLKTIPLYFGLLFAFFVILFIQIAAFAGGVKN